MHSFVWWRIIDERVAFPLSIIFLAERCHGQLLVLKHFEQV